ncbi:putative protein kinase [Trypanosoma grayi]|uniref:putative protein kinase n=1 Tax=Trypanosoma grayi TaxID=71804 RepID=UPI0004F43BBF|nr:putative protein kinase [Trypanosoma grayi]KEG11808.1 putative protein kinase [Trypanosoma grayi]
MGNQLAAATAVNVADVSSLLELVAPLGGEHRNYFRTFHCRKAVDTVNVGESLRSRSFFSTNESRTKSSSAPQRSQRAGSMDVVVRVFVRTLGNSAQQQLVDFCYDHLLKINARMTRIVVSPVVETNNSATSATTNNLSASAGAVPPPCNVLFYSSMEVQNDRFCKLERPYIAYSLAERLATRPYWNMGERLFAGYQILQSLVQLHDTWGTVHGDLKIDNVLVDTSGWLYVTDLSPFKPALLPANDPAVFAYYYDTNETRICFLAPEKFVDQSPPFSTSNVNASAHTQAMDIFSAGCVLAHMFTEEPLFSLSHVLVLRSQESQREREAMVDAMLTEHAVPPGMRRLLLDMLCTSPADRPNARQLLERFTPSVFPPYFGFLYRDVLPPLLARPPDLQVQLLWSRLEDILDEAERRCQPADFATSPQQLAACGEAKQLSVLLLLPVIVNTSRHLVTAEAFCRFISILQKVLPYCPVVVQSDTILPYILHYVKMDKHPVVARVLALRTLSMICHSVSFSASEATMFDDLVLPCVEEIVQNADTTDVALLAEVADQLPGLLLLARAFLEHRQALASANAWKFTFGEQLNDLLERGWDALRSLYRHEHTAVVVSALKRTPDVVKFLGDERAQDDLIPFLTTAIASAIDVQRELYPQAIMCHVNLQAPRLKTLRFFVDEGLRHTDVMCLTRTIDSITAVVEKKCLAVWDTMPLVHQALPHIINPNNWVSAATCRLVETAARTHRVSDLWMYLECALRPLLCHQVPLSRLASFPTAVKLELSHHPTATELLTASMHPPGLSLLGGDAGVRDHVQRSSVSGEPQYTVPYSIMKRTLEGLASRAALVDVSYDALMLEPVAPAVDRMGGSSDGHDCSASWQLFFKPTPRECKRLLLRQSRLIAEGDPTDRDVTATSDKCICTDNLYTTERRHRRGDIRPPSQTPAMTSVLWNEKELKPIAAPWFTQAAHLGGIYCSTAARGGTLVTAGGRGEATLWSLGAEGLDYSHRIQTGASLMSTFLFTNFLRDGLSSLLCMGGTDGEWRVYDVACNTIVGQRAVDGSALTAACSLSDSITLVSSALGGVSAIDHRAGKDMWHATVPPTLGSPSGVSPLFHKSRAYGASVVTLAGCVALFDLRFQMMVQEYHLHEGNQQTVRVTDNPSAILCVSPDLASPSLSFSSQPGLLLGTQAGAVHRLDLSSGESHIALHPATDGQATRALLVQPKHSVVLTAGNDMWIRKWSMAAPAQSRTLACPPYTSPQYVGTTCGSIREVALQNQRMEERPSTGNEPHTLESPSLRSGVVPRHHEDAILTLCSVSNGSETFLASGSRDGTLTVWFNAE